MTTYQELDFLSKYTNLDDFQLKAFDIINENEKNLLITAHTGSGKSLVAEYGIYNSVKNKKMKTIYTSPIKSLSNQKFSDFNNKFASDISIGILTGDIKFNPNADCVIMTTEILLNQLIQYNNTNSLINFSEIDCIIFDEVHYINDIDRGNVWEQSIMLIPNHIKLIMLSATLNQPDKFINWLDLIQHKPTELITTQKRVVPLSFNTFYWLSDGMINKLKPERKKIIKFNELVPIATTEKYLNDSIKKKFDNITYEKIVKFNNEQIKLTNIRWNHLAIISEMLRIFNHENYTENMFPLLFFVLNKKKCIDLARSINIIFNSPLEQVEVEKYINHIKSSMRLDYLDNIEQFDIIFKLAVKGIGVHHSGMLPIIKEIIEQLYEKKLIKVLFATETFAIGLNMPTKTVVFVDLYKCNRLLYSHEFIQMAGRAGRRNIDTHGYIILLPQLFKNNVESIEINRLLSGTGQEIISKLNIDELLILRMLNTNSSKDITTFDELLSYIQTSLLSSYTNSQIEYQKNILDNLQITYDKLSQEELSKINQIIELTKYDFKLDKKTQKKLNELISDSNISLKHKFVTNYLSEKKSFDQLFNYLRNQIELQLDKLVKTNMINIIDSNISLTNNGFLGSFIIDQNPIIIIDIITSEFFSKLDPFNIISLLSTLIFDDHRSDPMDFNSFKYQNQDNKNIIWISDLDKLLNRYLEEDLSYLIDNFNFDFVWLIDEFIRTGIYPVKYNDEDYLFEGNFVRSINQLLNLILEIKQLFDVTKTDTTILNEVIIMLQKDWLKPESLYLLLS